MVGDVSSGLHTFFVPQMEQLGLVEQPCRHGSLSVLDSELGSGTLWACSIGDDCLFTFHDLQLREPVRLMEFPEEYICITSMTESSARHCPIESRYLKERNTVSFHQDGGAVNFVIGPEERHRSYTFCMRPSFFESLEGLADSERELLVDHLESCDTNAHSREIGRALDDAVHGLDDCAGSSSSENKRIAHEAQAMIDARFAENLTLKSIASELYVGRTRLCEVFREEVGSCVAEYIRSRRLAEAKVLLETTDMKAAEVGRVVGYTHQSSFTDAFRREFGTTPSQWRTEVKPR